MCFIKRLANSILTYVPNMIYLCPNMAKNPPMLKLVFSLELKNSNFRSDGNLPSFDMVESFYRELWSGYLFSNFHNVDGS